ncbi:MAG: Rpn family recombination-promoting nuclease/putative transposase [Lachnospiraceae bacterium]|nr:Rpn family recombination-promoting nuclease/putative transposase [Lachnospiraceae bacterium]
MERTTTTTTKAAARTTALNQAQQQIRAEAIRKSAESMRSSNLLNDSFVSIALEDTDACQHVLRTILDTDDLNVVSVKGQYRLLNLTAKDSVLDVFAQDSRGRLMNVEIQRKDTVDHAKRTRYYSSMIDKSSLDKGTDYEDLPDVYIIYISETDLWNAGKTIYKVEKMLGSGKSAIPYDDGSHVIYVNAKVDDGSEVAKMMKYFKSADPDDMSQGALSKRVRYLKREEGGYKLMSAEAEKLYNLGVEEGIEKGIAQSEEIKAKEIAEAVTRMLRLGKLTIQEIAECQGISESEVRKIEAGMPQQA